MNNNNNNNCNCNCKKIFSKIVSVGSYLPSRIVTNFDLEKMFETSNEWILQRTGISERRWADENESTSDLALQASLRALEAAQLDKDQLDMIVFATATPDYDSPSTGNFLHAKLGVKEIPTVDIRQQCSGFIYALSIADLYIKSGQYKKILVVGSELQSKTLDLTNEGRDTAVLFGDGAGAVIMEATNVENDLHDSHIISTHLHTEGKYAKELWLPAPGSAVGGKTRISIEHLEKKLHLPYMNGKMVYVNAIRRMGESIQECCAFNNIQINDIDLFLFHQANLRIIDTITKKFQLPTEKVFNTLEKFANTTSATIPIGMDYALKENKLKPGMLVALSAFGSGFTWASALLRY